MKEAILRFWKDEEGATAIEYGLIAGLVAVVLAGTLTTLGKDLNGVFEEIIKKLTAGTGISSSGGGGSGG